MSKQSTRRYINIDTRTGARIDDDDLFIAGFREELYRLGEGAFRRARGLGPDESLSEAGFWFDENRFALNDNMGITRGGLVFYFNDYEIAPHALGPTAVFLRYDQLGSVLDRKNERVRDIERASTEPGS